VALLFTHPIKQTKFYTKLLWIRASWSYIWSQALIQSSDIKQVVTSQCVCRTLQFKTSYLYQMLCKILHKLQSGFPGWHYLYQIPEIRPYFQVFGHEKMLYGMYVRVRHFSRSGVVNGGGRQGVESPPRQAKCKSWAFFSDIWMFSILLVYSRMLIFCVFRGIFILLPGTKIHDIRIHCHSLTFFLSVG